MAENEEPNEEKAKTSARAAKELLNVLAPTNANDTNNNHDTPAQRGTQNRVWFNPPRGDPPESNQPSSNKLRRRMTNKSRSACIQNGRAEKQ